MGKGKILLADNIKRFADTRAEFLRKQGYTVFCAYSPEEAREIMHARWIHLAILDIRLLDDDDLDDTSGFDLANAPEFNSIPKMILTGFPTVDNVREALTQKLPNSSTILRFTSKAEGAEVMVKNVNEIFNNYIHINHSLVMRWKDPSAVSLAGIHTLLDENLPSEEILEHIQELADLLKMAFYSYDQITISKLLWKQDDRIALAITTFSGSGITQAILKIQKLKKGTSSEDQVTSPAQFTFPNLPQVLTQSRSINYVGIAWKMSEEISDSISLAEFIRENGERRIASALENLFLVALHPWYQTDLNVIDGNLGSQYQKLTKLLNTEENHKILDQKIRDLLKACVSTKLIADFEIQKQGLTLHLSNEHKITLNSPLSAFDTEPTENQLVRQILSPGGVELKYVLVDRDANVTLTDFASSALVPCERDFISLELDTRVHAHETNNLLNILEMEKEITSLTHLIDTVPTNNVDVSCRKVLSIIFTIRRLANQVFQSEVDEYYRGLYNISLQRLGNYSGLIRLTSQELLPSLHYLLICCFLADKIGQSLQNPENTDIKSGIWINESNHEVTLNERIINLTPTEYDLLLFLYNRNGNLCRREEIMKEVFKIDTFDPITEKSLLNTNMTRLRGKIEADASNPHFIITVRSQGYKLMKKPS